MYALVKRRGVLTSAVAVLLMFLASVALAVTGTTALTDGAYIMTPVDPPGAPPEGFTVTGSGGTLHFDDDPPGCDYILHSVGGCTWYEKGVVKIYFGTGGGYTIRANGEDAGNGTYVKT